ncbi:MAG: hypothetical protein COT84_00810 [Chlamydiae bacterium CG10_big_fil_rev_8_21_14_0_10_35_9]|nr:MAG: hypothetical protein COT84_00810 [Chlamydiae bacterium CG10_big_fil_rev_8_21_14_0_10_35_9]
MLKKFLIIISLFFITGVQLSFAEQDKYSFFDKSYFPHAQANDYESNLTRYVLDHLDLNDEDLVLDLNQSAIDISIFKEYNLSESQIIGIGSFDFKGQSATKIFVVDEPKNFHPFEDFIKDTYKALKPNGRIAFATILAKKANDLNIVIADDVKTQMKNTGFKDIHFEPLGKYVFQGSSGVKWQKHYQEDLIDFYLVVADKPVVLERA